MKKEIKDSIKSHDAKINNQLTKKSLLSDKRVA